MSEIALVSSKKIRLEAAMEAGKSGARTALDLAVYPIVLTIKIYV